MGWRDAAFPIRMSRVAVVAPRSALRDALVRVADAGVMEIERSASAEAAVDGPAARALRRLPPGSAQPRITTAEPDLDRLVTVGRADLVAGEAQIEAYRAEAFTRGGAAALVGWAPSEALPALSNRLGPTGAAVVRLPLPRGAQPPTAARPGNLRGAFDPLVRTYATVPYEDVDPTVIAGLAYLVMFGAMFGDLGHGALLVLGALIIRAAGRRIAPPRWLAMLRPHWVFIAGAGLSSAAFGVVYGEFFGPTGVIRPLWVSPMDQPVPLLLAAIGLGAVLLAVAYVLGTINRVREGGWVAAVYSPSGLAGGLLFVSAGVAVLGWWRHAGWIWLVAGGLAAVAAVLVFVGLLAGAGGGPAGALQASVELVDVVIRIGGNVVSFARLAAFGLTHAVLAWIVWQATAGLWVRGPGAAIAAVPLFVAGTAVAAGLEALVAAVQALRLEYYELFSRVFQVEGRPFRPWYVPTAAGGTEEEPCSPG